MGIYIDKIQLDQVKSIMVYLQDAITYNFSELSGPTAIPQAAGVYIIFDKATKEVYYVGKTTNLRQRIYNNNLMGPLTNARLKKYLIEDKTFPNITDSLEAKRFIRENCSFLYKLESDMRIRGHLEGLVSFLTNCRYVDKEH